MSKKITPIILVDEKGWTKLVNVENDPPYYYVPKIPKYTHITASSYCEAIMADDRICFKRTRKHNGWGIAIYEQEKE